MKTSIHTDKRITKAMNAKSRKSKSHGTYRAKRKPTSPRLRYTS